MSSENVAWNFGYCSWCLVWTSGNPSSNSITRREYSGANTMTSAFKDFGNMFMEDSGQLVALDTGKVMSAEVVNSIRNIHQIGIDKYQKFKSEQMLSQDIPWTATIPQTNLPLLSYTTKPSRKKSEVSILKQDRVQYIQMMLSAQSGREINEEVFSHESNEYPPSLTRKGEAFFGVKADLLPCLEEDIVLAENSPPVDAAILDGCVMLRLIPPGTSATFSQYSTKFVSSINELLNNVSRVDVVWDVRQELSVKLARSTRASGIRTKVRPTTKIPTNWQGFLCVGGNLEEVEKLIAVNIQEYNQPNKVILSTLGESVISSSDETDFDHMRPCTHEEADYRMMLHLADMVRNNITKVRIRTVDTDVLVISIAYYHQITGLEELWVAFGTGKCYRYIPVHTIARRLGDEKCKALLGFHALTGCDSVSAFYGIGKKGPWQVWKEFPEVTEAFSYISSVHVDIPENIMSLIEQFVVRIYGTFDEVSTVNKARYELFHFRGKDFDHLPPTQNALRLHIHRAAYTAGHIWGQALVKTPVLPSPALYGYERKGEQWLPTWTTLPTISKSHLRVCHCKKECKPPCVCATKKVRCTSLCTCHGDCYGHPH